jgi:hypothetical protein
MMVRLALALAEAVDEDGNLLFDMNSDGVLDADNTSYGEFRISRNLDQDGAVDEVEIRTLAEAGTMPNRHLDEKCLPSLRCSL